MQKKRIIMYRFSKAFIVKYLVPPEIFSQFYNLSCYFKSEIILENITKNRAAILSNKLTLLILGLSKGHLCKISFFGIDAELASFVFTNFIREYFQLIEISIQNKSDSFILNEYPSLTNNLVIRHVYHHITVEENFQKNDILSFITKKLIEEDQLKKDDFKFIFEALCAREEYSSTAIGNQIAIPHIMNHLIAQPILFVAKLSNPMLWHSQLGTITLVIAVFLPKLATKKEIRAVINLMRALSDKHLCTVLNETYEPEILHAILLDKMRNF